MAGRGLLPHRLKYLSEPSLLVVLLFGQDEIEMHSLFTRWKLVIWGILVLWIASIAFALQLKTSPHPRELPPWQRPFV